MASAILDSCDICTNTFNEDVRESVVLPCGHNYCLTCLAHLKAKGDDNCPSCRKNWTEIDLNALPAMAAVNVVLENDKEEKDDLCKSKRNDVRCKKHDLSFDFWVKERREFFCKRCAAEERKVTLELLEDVIPEIKMDLSREIQFANKKIELDLDSLEKEQSEFIEFRNYVKEFVKLATSLDVCIEEQIEQIVLSRSNTLKATTLTNKIESSITDIHSEADVNIILDSYRVLKQVMETSNRPTKNFEETLYGEIIYSYAKSAESATTAGTPFNKASFISTLLNGTTASTMEQNGKTEGSNDYFVNESTGTSFIEDSIFATNPPVSPALNVDITMDDNTAGHTLQTLLGRSNDIQLLVGGDEHKDSSANGSDAGTQKTDGVPKIKARFLDSFLKPKNSEIDGERLKILTANQRFDLTEFYGRLDAKGIAELPRTVRLLGLAIGGAADGDALHNLRPWRTLNHLKVCVDSRLPTNALKPLPDIRRKDLYFPFLTDYQVDNVKPAIVALVPNRRLSGLVLPKCQLSTDGVRRLGKLLLGIKITVGVIIESSDILKPDKEEQTDIKADFLSDLECNVFWNLEWISH